MSKKSLLIALPALLLSLTAIGCNPDTSESGSAQVSTGNPASDSQGQQSGSSEDSNNSSSSVEDDFTQGSNPYQIPQPTTKKPVGTMSEAGKMLKTSGSASLPSKGDVNILVVPVNFANSTNAFTSGDTNRLNSRFFGKSESLSNYFSLASYGNLNVEGVVGPTAGLTLPMTLDEYFAQTLTFGAGYVISEITDYVIDQIFVSDSTRTLDYRDFDADGDGEIDAISLVFCEPSYNSSTVYEDYNTQQAAAALLTPGVLFGPASEDSALKVGAVSWSPFDYLTTSFGIYVSQIANIMGIQNTNDLVGNSSTGTYRSPMGNTEIMDTYYMSDLTSFEKYQMGWISPKAYTAADISEEGTTITLNKFASSGDAVLLGIGDASNPFSEYVLLDFFDLSFTYTASVYGNVFNQAGVRALKVDARLAKNDKGRWYLLGDEKPDFTDGAQYDYAFSNSSTGDYYSDGIVQNYPLVTFLSSQQTNRWVIDGTTSQATSQDLFLEGDSFGTDNDDPNDFYAHYQFNGNGFNGDELGIHFTVDSVTDTAATITLRRAK